MKLLEKKLCDYKKFEALMTYMIENEESRDRLFSDPLDLEEIQLTHSDRVVLKRIGRTKIRNKNKSFNEKLVLCSSSGV